MNFILFSEPSPDLFQLGIDKYRNNKEITLTLIKYNRALQLYKLNKGRKDIYIESNPNLLLLLPELNKLFQESKDHFHQKRI